MEILMGQAADGRGLDESIHADQAANPIETIDFSDIRVDDNKVRWVGRHFAEGRFTIMRPLYFSVAFMMQGFGQFEPVNLEAFERFLEAELGTGEPPD